MNPGALLIFGSASAIGIAGAGELHRETERFAALQRVLELLEVSVCRRGMSLPLAMEEAEAEGSDKRFIELFDTGREPATEDEALFRTLCLRLGGGEVPEKAFSGICEEAERKRAEAAGHEQKLSRLYVSGGICIGAILALVLM